MAWACWRGSAASPRGPAPAGPAAARERPKWAIYARCRAGPSAAGQPGVLLLQFLLHLAGKHWVAGRGMQGGRDAGGVASGQCGAHDSQRAAGVLLAVGSAPSRVQVGGVDAHQRAQWDVVGLFVFDRYPLARRSGNFVVLHRPRPERDDVLEAPTGRDVLLSQLVSGVDVSRLARAQDGSSDAEIGVLPARHGLTGGEVSPGLLAGIMFGIGDAARLQGVVIRVNDEDPDIARQRKPRHQAVFLIQ